MLKRLFDYLVSHRVRTTLLLLASAVMVTACATKMPGGTLMRGDVRQILPPTEVAKIPAGDAFKKDKEWVKIGFIEDMFGGGSYAVAWIPVGSKIIVGDLVEMSAGAGPGHDDLVRFNKVERILSADPGSNCKWTGIPLYRRDVVCGDEEAGGWEKIRGGWVKKPAAAK